MLAHELEEAERDLSALYAERRRLERASVALYALAEAARVRRRRASFSVPYPKAPGRGEELLIRVEAEQEVEAELLGVASALERTPA